MVSNTQQNFSIASLLSRDVSTTLVVSSIFLASVAGYYYLQNVYSHWSKRGVKGPKPLPLVGNYFQYISGDRLKKEVDWPREYGKLYGSFAGLRPYLMVADAEILLQICVKDFEAFPNHDLAQFSSKFSHNFLIKLKDGHWKRTRALMSPTFTSSKMKRMFRFMDGCAEDLIQCVREKFPTASGSAVVNVKELYNLFTLDTISTCCYGLKLEREGSANKKAVAFRGEFVKMVMKMFEVPVFRTLLLNALPKGFTDLINFKVTPDSWLDPLGDFVRRLVDQRRNSPPKKLDDYLQLLVDARLDDKMELNDMDLAENHHAGLTSESMLKNQEQMIKDAGDPKEASKFTLSDEEIVANAMFLLAVGLETTGSLLAHCSYALAFHPEIQQRLYEEVMAIAEFDGQKKRFKFDYDATTSCRYLDAVISETLRRLCPVVSLDRISSRDYYIEKYDIHLPKGSHLGLEYFAILNDPDYWPEPERFDPERFMPGNREKIVPGSYCPFGLGPRHCIGMRFSLTEAKLALAKMLMSFKFEPAPGTKFPPEPKMILALTAFKNPIVSVKHRSLDISPSLLIMNE